MLLRSLLIAALGVGAAARAAEVPSGPTTVKLDTIQIRDPFILPVADEQRYYLFGTTDKDCWGPKGTGFDTYRSADLVNWEGPLPAFRPPEGFWGTRNFWAPEAHRFGDAYYLFASFKNDNVRRGTAILRATRPEGPYLPHSDGAVTPRDWECLDGTLFVERDGRPWMVFCHEWVQVGDGEMCAVPLTRDLRAADGAPVTLFRASEAPWAINAKADRKSLVTDGPFLHRTKSGRLLMLWSTIGPKGYTMGCASSADGTLHGPWTQLPEPLFAKDGGHGMIFRSFEGQLMLTLHQPNKSPNERAKFFPLEETSDGLLRVGGGEPPAVSNGAPGGLAPKPLFRDPVCDGAADPVVLWNPYVKRWWMFYTNRRANVPGLSGVAWVHGTKIGIAESADGGAHWTYVGTCDIELPAEFGGAESTHWAPEVITAPDGSHHMWLTVVPGVFENWQHPRTLVHLTSTDLRTWRHAAPLTLASDRVIDACILRLDDGTWRLWYNNERDHKSIYCADSTDLVHWTDQGKAVADQAGEGPKVFRWKNSFWMITDVWRGLGVYRSADGRDWMRQPGENLLQGGGTGPDDGVKGGHCDVVVSGERAFLFYFTHPGRTPGAEKTDGAEQRRSSIQVVELHEQGGVLRCDRDAPTRIALSAP